MRPRREDILFLSASKRILKNVREVFEAAGEEYLVYEAALADAVRIARSCIERFGTKIVISTGGTGDILQQSVDAHVLIMRYRGEDIIEAIQQADPVRHKVAVVGFESFVHTAIRVRPVFSEELHFETVNGIEDMRVAVDALVKDGYDTVVGGSVVANLARVRGLRGVHIGMEKEVIADTLDEAKRLVSLLEEKDARLATTNAILDAITDGIIACDGQGHVQSVNQAGTTILGLSRHDLVGRPLAELVDAPFLARTLATGEEFTGALVDIRGARYSATCVPVRVEQGVIGAVLTVQELSRLHMELDTRKKVLASGHVARNRFASIVGSSRAIEQAKRRAALYADTDSTVLLYGRTGTGKELFAQSIHNASPRAKGPFVAVNCGALPESLLESELFGYVRGAFTGARTGGKTGLFEMAQGGTIFLDEISEMAPSLQARLLRVCQEREITRIGDDRVIPVDVRVVAAANRDLLTLVRAGSFREDLYYRLAVLILELPTLADRMEDLEELATALVRRKARELHRSMAAIPPESVEVLRTISWPGNVRQLANVLERAIILCRGRILTPDVMRDAMDSCRPFLRDPVPDSPSDSFPGGQGCACVPAFRPPSPSASDAGTGADRPLGGAEERAAVSDGRAGAGSSNPRGATDPRGPAGGTPTLAEAEDRLLDVTLAACGGNLSEAARRLGIGRTTLWRRLKRRES